jgi:hypothetical protein
MVVFMQTTIQNKGIEIEFDANLLSSTSPLKWNVFGNWSRNRNEVTKLEGTESLFLDGFAGSSSRAVLGQPLVCFGSKFATDTNSTLILDSNGFPTVAPIEGVIGDPNQRGSNWNIIKLQNITLSTLLTLR